MIRTDYLVAADAAAELLAAPELARAWLRPSALAHYTVAGLAGHLAGQIFFAERALAEPPGDAELIDIVTYYDRVAWRHAGHDEPEHVRIREGSARLAADGPTALAERAADAVRRLPAMLAAEPEDRLVQLSLWDWRLRLDDFLLGRTMELLVHIDDLAVSIGVPTPEPARPDATLALLTTLAARQHGATALLRALTRAERAPATIAAF
jgi:hypothetical protein